MQDFDEKYREFEALLKDIQSKDINATRKSNPKLLENHMSKYGLIPPSKPKKSYLDLRNQQNKNWAYQQTIEGIALFKNSEINSAKKKYNAAIELDERCVEALVARGCCYASEKRYKDALADFEAALEVDPAHKNAKSYREQIQETMDRLTREKKNTEKSLRNGEFILPENFGRGKKKEVYVAKDKLPVQYEKQYELVDEDYGYKKKKKKKKSKRESSVDSERGASNHHRSSSDKYSKEDADKYSRKSTDRDQSPRDTFRERKSSSRKESFEARDNGSEKDQRDRSKDRSRDRSKDRSRDRSRERSRDQPRERSSKRSRIDKSPQ
ncbi:Tetratricopeptide repeat protein 14 [Terramyces sp. JEL0728]|nr:Tetratricopeptide repeat protein 14 [Terramyces sp. JEL0728]